MGDFCLQNHRREPAPPYGQLQKLRAARACPLPQENLRRAYAGFSSPSSARPTVYALLASRGRRPARARSPAAQVERGRQARGGQGARPGRCHEGRPLSESAHITVTVTCLPPWSQRPQSQHQLSGPEQSTQCTCREGTVCHATGRPALAGRRLAPSASSAARPCSREEGRGSPRGGGLRLRPPVPATHIPAEARGGWVPTAAEGARSLMVAEAVRAAAVAEAGWPPLWDHALGAECLSGSPCPEPGPGLHAGLRWVSVGGWAGTRTRGKLTRQAEPHRRACPLPETRRLSRLHLPVAPVCQAVGQALMGGRKLTGPREG